MGNRIQELYNQVMFERRILFGCTVLVGLSVILWIIAISTDHWFYVSGGPNGIYVNETKRFFMHSNSGLWRICRTSVGNATGAQAAAASDPNMNVTVSGRMALFRKCKYHEMWPTDAKVKSDPFIDKTILNYTRSETSFSIISLLLMSMGFFFSIYTFRNPRYMFKRLAGGIHFLACFSVLAVIEVLINSIAYEQKHLMVTFPKGATYSYGYSIVLAWLVFIFILASGCAFMLFSRKRKGNKAPTEEMAMADEPTIIGR
ncbi:transmembrane protein 114 [Anabrus simplex]|uniref:transmembrane protein 114 n=1 Tax=Anabrus simplex TaxID=316456 RepID=UPI0034DCEE69